MQDSTLKERLAEFLLYLGIGQAKFAEIVGVSRGFANNVGDSIREDNLKKISAVFPELNTAWLKTGEGDMLKGRISQKIGPVSGGIGNIGEIHGDYNNNNGGKDRAIVEQEKNVQYSLDVLMMELQRYHAQLERKDVYLRELIEAGYKRDAENARRIDELLSVITEQHRAAQARTDKLIDLLGVKK